MAEHDIAVVFPGQGSQRPGMGKDFCQNFLASAEAFEEASQALGWDVGALCFEEDDRLNLTEYAQPCILTTEIAMLRALESEFGLRPDYFGGHSLGEYTALVAAGALPLGEAARIVQTRGRLMQEACPVGTGAMAAVISPGLDAMALVQALKGLPMDIANINSPDQVVISGHAEAAEMARARLEDALAGKSLRFVPLNVSAPFHSRFMKSVARPFREALESVAGAFDSKAAARVTSNYSGAFHASDAVLIMDALTAQLSHPVRWAENMQALMNKGSRIWEVGPNKPLRGFFKALGADCASIISVATAIKAFEKN